MEMMKITVDIDEDLLNGAKELTGISDIDELMDIGLRELIESEELRVKISGEIMDEYWRRLLERDLKRKGGGDEDND